MSAGESNFSQDETASDKKQPVTLDLLTKQQAQKQLMLCFNQLG